MLLIAELHSLYYNADHKVSLFYKAYFPLITYILLYFPFLSLITKSKSRKWGMGGVGAYGQSMLWARSTD